MKQKTEFQIDPNVKSDALQVFEQTKVPDLSEGDKNSIKIIKDNDFIVPQGEKYKELIQNSSIPMRLFIQSVVSKVNQYPQSKNEEAVQNLINDDRFLLIFLHYYCTKKEERHIDYDNHSLNVVNNN